MTQRSGKHKRSKCYDTHEDSHRHILLGHGGSLLTLLTGGWLILAPSALGYQAGNTGSWTDMTQKSFWVGCGVVLVSLAGLMFFARARGRVASGRRGACAATTQAQPQPAAPESAAVPATRPDRPELEQTLARLAEALAADLAERRKTDTGYKAEPATVGRER